VMNARKQEVGLVAEDGAVYLSGLVSGEQMSVYWAGKQQCHITLPELIENVMANLLLPCIPVRTLLDDIAKH